MPRSKVIFLYIYPKFHFVSSRRRFGKFFWPHLHTATHTHAVACATSQGRLWRMFLLLLLQIRNQIVFNFQNESNMSNPSMSAPFIHSFIHITWPSGPIRQAPVAASPPPKKVRNCAISCSCHKCSTPSPLPPFYDAPALTFYLVCVCVWGVVNVCAVCVCSAAAAAKEAAEY